eukprot:4222785-Amphidinium_carterae.1
MRSDRKFLEPHVVERIGQPLTLQKTVRPSGDTSQWAYYLREDPGGGRASERGASVKGGVQRLGGIENIEHGRRHVQYFAKRG